MNNPKAKKKCTATANKTAIARLEKQGKVVNVVVAMCVECKNEMTAIGSTGKTCQNCMLVKGKPFPGKYWKYVRTLKGEERTNWMS